jgi:hypothetical protein
MAAMNQKIAGGSVVLTANADQMVAGLDRAKGKVDEWGQKTQKAMTKLGTMAGGGGGDFMAHVFGAGFFGGIVGAVAVKALGKAVEAISDLIHESAKWEAELARVEFRAGEVERAFARMLSVRDEWTAAGTREEKPGRLAMDVATAQRLYDNAKSAIEVARNLNTELNSMGGLNFHLFMRGDLRRSQAEAAAELKRWEAEAVRAGERLADVKDKLEQIRNPEKNRALVGEINKTTEAFQLQAMTVGMAAEDAKIIPFVMQNATDKMLAQVRVAAAIAKEARQVEEIWKSGPKFSPAMLAGSKEAYSIELKNRYGEVAPKTGIEKLQEKTNILLGKIVEILPSIATGTI